MHRAALGRLASAVILLAAVLAAVALVSTPRTDHATACGTAIDSALHGVRISRNDLPPYVGEPGPFGPRDLVTVCRNMSRERILAAAAVIGVAVVWADAVRRRSRAGEPSQLEPQAAAS